MYALRTLRFGTDILTVGGFGDGSTVQTTNVIDTVALDVHQSGSLDIGFVYAAPVVVESPIQAYCFGGQTTDSVEMNTWRFLLLTFRIPYF